MHELIPTEDPCGSEESEIRSEPPDEPLTLTSERLSEEFYWESLF